MAKKEENITLIHKKDKHKNKTLTMSHAARFLALQAKCHNNDFSLPEGFLFNGTDIEKKK